jgi:tetratricopeptide (TPR) repeat protein
MATTYKVGDRIQNRWEIHYILCGGMGEVYIVYDHGFQQAFAAKSFRREILRDNPGLAQRFQREAEAWIKLDRHPNVTEAAFFEVVKGKPLLFLEYVSGGDLSRWIREGRLYGDIKRVLTFGIHFCDGMIHCQSKGIEVHRDIKPQNCLIIEDGTLKVTDFGLAKLFDGSQKATGAGEDGPADLGELQVHLTQTGATAGTYTHMAPEQWRDAKHVDVRADIYAFGVMLYEMAAGRLPFEGRTREALKAQHEGEQPKPIKEPDLNEVVQTCLDKVPGNRYQNFGQVREILSKLYERKGWRKLSQKVTGLELDVIGFSNRGVSLSNLGKHEEALAYHNRALAINHRYAFVWDNKGASLSKLGRWEEALDCFDQALGIDPAFANGWHNKAWTLENLGKPEEALVCYDRALQLDARRGTTWFDQGVLLDTLGRYEQALACYDMALQINPEEENYWINKGVSLERLKRYKESVLCYSKAVAINPQQKKGWYNCGVVLVSMGRYSEALDCFKRTVKIDPRDVSAWYNSGSVLFSMGRYKEAVDCFDNTIKFDPKHVKSWTNRGSSLAALDRPEEALGSFDRALEIDAKHASTWFNKGVALFNLGRCNEALDYFESAQRLGVSQAPQAIALCRRKLGGG